MNCGCPSDRVGGKDLLESKQFGARLMHKPELVKRCVHAMARTSGPPPPLQRPCALHGFLQLGLPPAGHVPVTVKCRLGTNQVGGYENLCNFVREVASIHTQLKVDSNSHYTENL